MQRKHNSTLNLAPFSALFLSLALLLFITSCSIFKKESTVDLSVFENGLEYGTQWAVINDPYATFRVSHDFAEAVSGHGRRGDIEKVLGEVKVPIKDDGEATQIWFAFEKGWIPESSLVICSNLFKAKQISASISD
jgi:hypothetical protein